MCFVEQHLPLQTEKVQFVGTYFFLPVPFPDMTSICVGCGMHVVSTVGTHW